MMTNIELSESTSFMERYIAALFLPHTDATEFPNVTQRLQANAKQRTAS